MSRPSGKTDRLPPLLEPLESRTHLAVDLFASLPSTGDTTPTGVATDPQGNLYVAGLFKGTVDLDPSAATADVTAGSMVDLYLAKYSAGGALLWSRQWTHPSAIGHTALATDAAGNVYLAGSFDRPLDADPTSGTFTLTPRYSNINLFLIGLDPAGNFRTANRVATHHMDMSAVSLETDGPGHVYLLAQSEVPGRTQGDDLKIDTVLYQFRSSGRALRAQRWTTPVWWGRVEPRDMAVTDAGDVYVTGWGPQSLDYKPGRGTRRLEGGTFGMNAFLLHLTPAGQLAFALGLNYGNSGDPSFDTIAVDDGGNAYVAGRASNYVDFNPSRRKRHFIAPTGGPDIYHNFIAKYAPDARLLATTTVDDHVYDGRSAQLAVDASTGNVLLAGTQSPSNPPVPTPGKLQAPTPGGLFLATYSPDLDFVSASGVDAIETLIPFFPHGPWLAPIPTGGFYLAATSPDNDLALYPTPPATVFDLSGRTFVLKVE